MTDSLGTILTAMVTPFTAEMKVDHRRLADLARFLVEHGSDGLVVAGTTGESPTLTDDEKIALTATVLEAVGDRCTVVAGTGSNDTAHSVRLTQRAEREGAHAALVVTPYYNKPPERGLIEHFRAVAGGTGLPIVVYNIPGRCVVNLSPEALATLAEVDNIVAVKQANPDLAETHRLRELSAVGIYAGNDDMLLDVLRMGGWGGICVASHLVGPQLAEMARLVRSGDEAGAAAVDERLRPLYKTLFITASPIPVKTAMNLLGHKVGGLRLPLVTATAAETETIAAELRRLDLLA
jgi:4-hydroxy-tetrahydrodipicolinate synthase